MLLNFELQQAQPALNQLTHDNKLKLSLTDNRESIFVIFPEFVIWLTMSTPK